ncbi:hypothetical protein G7Y89_g14375 [Cudoniella acicularis]|uniref:Uncharacterized protein n=1 Tax=Cudoniella acicularis TaxID=354080 RepID=A0A8H4R597_9HELO|nr:hypothetical protein G7Y89_g14375 [Cudoniella acicularis]
MTLNVGDPYSTNDNITLKRSQSLTDDWDHAEEGVVFNPDPDSGLPYETDLWAPEIHNISGTWYIIFSETPDYDSPPPLVDAMCPFAYPAINHRMFVLKGDGPDPWTCNFNMKGMLNTFDQFVIDGTYFQYNNQLYMIYSCWENTCSGWPANLCITQLSNLWTVISNLTDRRMISVPDQPWEQVPYGRPVRLATNEGPEQLVNPATGQSFVIYSAARVSTSFYCLGVLELIGNDPMQYQSWRKYMEGCVFHQNTQAGVYGTNHASFTTSPDGSQNYIVYHALTTLNPPSDIYRTGFGEKKEMKSPKAALKILEREASAPQTVHLRSISGTLCISSVVVENSHKFHTYAPHCGGNELDPPAGITILPPNWVNQTSSYNCFVF